MEIGGYKDVPDWPKIGPSLLIATALIVAIRTAKWSAAIEVRNSNSELDKEIAYAANVAQRVLSALTSSHPSIFPSKKTAVVSTDERRSPGVIAHKISLQMWQFADVEIS
ncbi:MAG TPA: hypothetical protein VG498_13690 [Terriglobales bacterium]|nr:hypothetical protein [Terriglobales bacterium]